MLDFICQKVLENNFHFLLESTCRLQRDKKTKEMVDEINKLYVEKCQGVRKSNEKLLSGTDRYVGQALWEFLNKK